MEALLGLFVGAVTLALAYRIFVTWLDPGPQPSHEG